MRVIIGSFIIFIIMAIIAFMGGLAVPGCCVGVRGIPVCLPCVVTLGGNLGGAPGPFEGKRLGWPLNGKDMPTLQTDLEKNPVKIKI